MNIWEFAPIFIIAFMLGAMAVFGIWRYEIHEQEEFTRKKILEMKARIKPFQELAKECVRAKDEECYQKCVLDIYRIISEYAPNF